MIFAVGEIAPGLRRYTQHPKKIRAHPRTVNSLRPLAAGHVELRLRPCRERFEYLVARAPVLEIQGRYSGRPALFAVDLPQHRQWLRMRIRNRLNAPLLYHAEP